MDADICLVFARTGTEAGARGISVFLVPLDLPGISRSPIADMGFLPMGRAAVWFDGVRVPANNLIGEEGKGFYLIMKIFSTIRVGVPLICLGAARASLEEAVDYARQRHAFGQPIGRFQGVSFKLAEDAAHIEAAQMLSYRALWLADQGLSNAKEAAMCKWLGPQVSAQVIHDCLLIHGHVGYSEELPLEQRLRDVIGYEFGAGTAEIMKILVARELLGNDIVG